MFLHGILLHSYDRHPKLFFHFRGIWNVFSFVFSNSTLKSQFGKHSWVSATQNTNPSLWEERSGEDCILWYNSGQYALWVSWHDFKKLNFFARKLSVLSQPLGKESRWIRVLLEMSPTLSISGKLISTYLTWSSTNLCNNLLSVIYCATAELGLKDTSKEPQVVCLLFLN